MPLLLGDDVCEAYWYVIYPDKGLTHARVLLLKGDFTEQALHRYAIDIHRNALTTFPAHGLGWEIPLAALPKVLPCYGLITTCWHCGNSHAHVRKCSTCWVHVCSPPCANMRTLGSRGHNRYCRKIAELALAAVDSERAADELQRHWQVFAGVPQLHAMISQYAYALIKHFVSAI